MKEKTTRSSLLQVRLTPEELKKIRDAFSKSISKKLSDFLRKKLLDKPIKTFTRNQSLDDFMAEMIRLRNELNYLGNNFNQMVKKLNSSQQIEDVLYWTRHCVASQQILIQKIDQINSKIIQINDQWLQS